MKTVISKIKTSYGLDDRMIINFRDLFVVKYSEEIQNKLDLHYDGSFLSINILNLIFI
jgi:hypothetical protein